MASMRIIRINELLRDHLSEILKRDISLKQGVLVTLIKVDTSPDLRYTRMFISVFPEKENHYVSETLKKELSRIQKSLYTKLSMKPLPKLSFIIDGTAQKADEVEKLLKKIF